MGYSGENIQKTLPPTVKSNIDALNLPKTSFHSWSGFHAIETPSSSAVYELKGRYTLSEVKSLANTLSAFDTVKDYEDFVMSYTIGNKGQVASLLVFNKTNGEFSYKATDGIPLSSKIQSNEDKIYDFLKRIQWYDPTLKVIADYKLRNDQDVTYYEIKRDWQAAGLPILNPIGLLNLDEDKSLTELELNDPSTSVDRNSDIYDTSDNKDGLARNADFNTMTVGISNRTNNVVVVKSNLRKVTSKITEKSQIIPYEQAAKMLKKNEQSFIVTTPANISNVNDWQKIYPNQIAEAQEATITESALAYLEQSPTAEQKKLEPFYIFRGKATLSNSYQVNFIAAVPATTDTQAFKLPSFSLIPPAYAIAGDLNNPIGQIGGQKQGAFDLFQTPTPPPSPTPAYSSCIPAAQDLNPYNTQGSANGILGYGWSPVAVINGKIQMSRRGWWYFVPAEGTNDATLRNDLNQILIAIQQYTGQQMNFRNFNTGIPPNILSDFQATGTACPIRVTGDSPTIFVYAPSGFQMKIKPASTITYAEPLLHNQTWEVVSTGDGNIKVNGTNQKYLYYEYSDVKFNRPEKGWIVRKADILEFSQNKLAILLHLNHAETERLMYEINHAASKIDGPTVFIAPVDKKEVDHKLPLSILPQTDLNRYIFFVGKNNADILKVHEPKIAPVERTEYMIVELGSYAEK